MADVTFAINPIVLANVLTNAVEISKEASSIQAPEAVLLAYQPSADGLAGQVMSYGCGRYAAGRTVVTLDGLPSTDAMSVSLGRDHAIELASALRKTSRAADTRVGVNLTAEAVQRTNQETGVPSWGNLAVGYKDAYLAVLHDADPHGKYDAIWQRMDELASVTGDSVGGVTLQVGILSRLQKMKGVGEVADIRTTQLPGVVAAKIGPTFVALLGEINRPSYVSGGRWSDGPGDAANLWR
ncbi:hypothetical protein J2X12_002839 [Pseudarthrobacter oxydans]|uniref:Uncharacterized protein n=1 Tax=Pseudarthrobacter oxydans TaxID=1671 RepID=A0AAW8ND71_PSEOX|nr:hypothetical protein [Pseudarthrobacter oxydans]MDR6794828.1 hypothetical protein [Pseudarthrobacter oxydans]MDR7164801.1 hypothetical protein [Pseudarthrobacter oxydans]